jgi:hypothetical protein
LGAGWLAGWLPLGLKAPPPLWRPSGRAQQSRKAAAGGPLQVALGWGQVQEPAALAMLLDLLPSSLLCETGLHVVAQEMLPAGFALAPSPRHQQASAGAAEAAASGDSSPAAGSLPLLGASPDGLVQHSISLTAAALQELEPLLLELRQAGQADPAQVSDPPPPAPSTPCSSPG